MEYSSAMPFEIADLMREIGVYIRLVWLFAIIITALMLLLCCLYLAKRRSLARESASLEFSNLVIEGMEVERRRVSRELHDIVLPQVRGMEVYDTIREICMELMPPDFSRLSLKDALVNLCNKFIKRSGIECAIFLDNELDFTPISVENQLHLYRIVQEAFTNIEKHSKTGKAVLVARRSICGEAESMVICISNDNEGLENNSGSQSNPLSASPGTGLGMRNMRHRAAIIGANLDFVSEAQSFMVRIEIPQ